jgi:hypothetical protein
MALADVNARERELLHLIHLFERLDRRGEFSRMMEMLRDPNLQAMLRTHMAMTSFPWCIEDCPAYLEWVAVQQGNSSSAKDVNAEG